MTPEELRERTRQFAFDVIRLCLGLKNADLATLVKPQLLRAGTGVAANYRAATRASSLAEFCSRLAVVIEEADESDWWLDVVHEFGGGPQAQTKALRSEAGQLRAIFAKSRSTASARLANERQARRRRREVA